MIQELFPHLHKRGGDGAPGPGSTCAEWGWRVGGQRCQTRQRLGLFPSQTPSRHRPLYLQSLAAAAVDVKKEKLLDKKKFKKKK